MLPLLFQVKFGKTLCLLCVYFHPPKDIRNIPCNSQETSNVSDWLLLGYEILRAKKQPIRDTIGPTENDQLFTEQYTSPSIL